MTKGQLRGSLNRFILYITRHHILKRFSKNLSIKCFESYFYYNECIPSIFPSAKSDICSIWNKLHPAHIGNKDLDEISWIVWRIFNLHYLRTEFIILNTSWFHFFTIYSVYKVITKMNVDQCIDHWLHFCVWQLISNCFRRSKKSNLSSKSISVYIMTVVPTIFLAQGFAT